MAIEQNERNVRLTPDLARTIQDWGERTFATAVTSKENLQVDYQVPLGEKVIDFHVRNKGTNGHGRGMLVEVADRTRKSANRDRRKRSQKNVLKASGERFTILYRDNLNSISIRDED